MTKSKNLILIILVTVAFVVCHGEPRKESRPMPSNLQVTFHPRAHVEPDRSMPGDTAELYRLEHDNIP